MSTLIPKGFFPIALTDLHGHKAIAYYNRDRHLLMFVVDGAALGPIEADMLESFIHVLKDVTEMKGRYHPLMGGLDVD